MATGTKLQSVNKRTFLIPCTSRQLRAALQPLLVFVCLVTLLMINALFHQYVQDQHREDPPGSVHLSINRENSSKKIIPPFKESRIQWGKGNHQGFIWPAQGSVRTCQEEQKTLTILIHTARGNFRRRDLIRQTWGKSKLIHDWTLVPVFLLGVPLPHQESEKVARALEMEYDNFGDLALKADFMDTYSNLSRKHVAGYEWASSFCPGTSAILKTDDDFVVDIFRLVHWLETLNIGKDNHSYFCRVYGGFKPLRNPKSKWRVSPQDYQKDIYPPFCSGGAYVTFMPVVKAVLQALPQTPYLWLDDVYVTGLAVQVANAGQKLDKVGRKQKKPWRIRHKNRWWEYFYYEWEHPRGMDLIREWAGSSVQISRWSFILVENTPRFEVDFQLLWKKIKSLYHEV